MVQRRISLFLVLNVLAAAAAALAPLPAAAAPPTVDVIVGGLGAGPATGVGQRPISVAVTASTVYLLETPTDLPCIDCPNPITVRAVNRATGVERVVAGPADFDGQAGGSTVQADDAGNVFLTDSNNHRVLRVDPAGTVSTYGGTGTAGFSGDTGQAAAAQVSMPMALYLAADGTLYFFDYGNMRVRKITAAGVISTVAGTGAWSTSDAGGVGTATAVGWVRSITSDGAGGLYLVEDERVRRLTSAGVLLTVHTTGGRGSALDGSGRLHVTAGSQVDRFNADGSRERVVGTGANGFAGDGGPALSAQLNSVRSLAFASNGDLFIADAHNFRVRRVSAGAISTFAGNGSQYFGGEAQLGTDAQIWDPAGLAKGPSGQLAVADRGNQRIRVLGADNRLRTVAGNGAASSTGDGGPAANATVNLPYALAYGPDGSLYFVEAGRSVIRRISPSGTMSLFATGAGPIGAVAVDGVGNVYFTEGDGLRKVNTAGALSTIVPTAVKPSWNPQPGGSASDLSLTGTAQLAFDSAGNLYAAGQGGVVQLDLCGTFSRWDFPDYEVGVAVDPAANIFVSLYDDNTVRRIGRDGSFTTVATLPDAGQLAVSGADLLVGEPSASRVVALRGVADTASGAARGCYTPPPPPPPPVGYWMVGSAGNVYAFGDSPHVGDASPVSVPVVDLEPGPFANGYWIVNELGFVTAHGLAHFGSLRRSDLLAGERITSMSRDKDGNGYWLFSTLGRVFAFGQAKHFGDMAGKALNGVVLDSIPTPSGLGYYMVASDGGIFAFGDAGYAGSMGGKPLNAPVQSLVPDGDGRGYWLVASDGGIFAFDAPFRGSMGGKPLNKPVTGMVRFGNGYLMVGTDGGIFNFSEKPFLGSLGANPPPHAIVSVASRG
jgi:hypothetical protein